MTKRQVERNLNDLGDEVLDELDPEVRLQLWVEAAATGNKDWIDRLRETAPIRTYRATDLAYVERGRFVLDFLSHAIYRLHTTALQHELLDQHQKFWWVVDSYQDTDPSEEDLTMAGKRADQIKDLYLDLYTAYNAYQQFANEVIGVDLETWFALHPDGRDVLEMVNELLDDEMRYDLAEEFLNASLEQDVAEGEVPDSESITLNELAERRYQGLVQLWEDAIERAV